MIIVSSRKFRDNQNTYFEKANSEEVILQTLRYGSFRLVPVREGDAAFSDVRKASEEKNAALVANFHKGGKASKSSAATSASAPRQEEAPAMPAIDIAELVKAAVQEAVAAAVPAAAAAAAAAQAQKEIAEAKPARAPRSSRKAAAVKDEERPELVLSPARPDPEPAVTQVPEPEATPLPSAPAEKEVVREYAPLFAEETVGSVTPSAPVSPASPTPVQEVKTAPAPVPAPKPQPVPRAVPRVQLPVEDELEHEPIPEPSDEVKRHIHPVREASADVKPDFVDPGLYEDYEDSYIVGEERPDLEAQLAAYRKQEKGGFFKRFFKK